MATHRITFNAMACGCEVVLVADSSAQARALAQTAVDEVQRIERTFSRYRSDSVVSRINAAAGREAIECDAETNALLDYADQLFQISGGLFDITSGVLRRAWNFKQARVPTRDELRPLQRLIGWRRVERWGPHVRLPTEGMEIDFGGFGKEYAADRAGAALAAQGVHHGYVNLGGDMRVLGPKQDGQPWLMGIQHPRQTGALVASLPVSQGGLATSGDYERFFEINNRRYCHILHPHTGMPVTHWRSVSVLAPLAAMAGSCTTLAMLKGSDGLAFLQGSGLDFLALDFEGRIHTQAGIAAQAPLTRTAQTV